MDSCVICLEDIQEHTPQWACQRCTCKMHNNCFSKCFDKSCPVCRQENSNGDHTLCKIGQTYNMVSSVVPYMELWTRTSCLYQKHSLILHKPYGVIIKCVTCGACESFNWIGWDMFKTKNLEQNTDLITAQYYLYHFLQYHSLQHFDYDDNYCTVHDTCAFRFRDLFDSHEAQTHHRWVH